MRTLILALAVASPSATLAEDLFPTFDSGWRWAITEPAPGGLQRFGYVDGEPGRPGYWRVRVECGLQDPRTGRVLKRVIGTGEGTRGRMPGFGGRWDLPDGRCGSYIVTQDDRHPERLDLYGEMTGVDECPRSGRGALSTGD
ncbi:hypothetical protein [Methylobacterium sp. ARG-1]|uniref:hypothetical protein n=1 Tax=Methylobacterium sp. ARG-1 TaxID=1692501 RepID=UPI0006815346|nr:hypothetical protein [Methylobacterium sp. ARG-1]KNY22647.1 hypothetical protein AKJ13_10305 [Methylobacterium sp. ARG-1]